MFVLCMQPFHGAPSVLVQKKKNERKQNSVVLRARTTNLIKACLSSWNGAKSSMYRKRYSSVKIGLISHWKAHRSSCVFTHTIRNFLLARGKHTNKLQTKSASHVSHSCFTPALVFFSLVDWLLLAGGLSSFTFKQ